MGVLSLEKILFGCVWDKNRGQKNSLYKILHLSFFINRQNLDKKNLDLEVEVSC